MTLGAPSSSASTSSSRPQALVSGPIRAHRCAGENSVAGHTLLRNRQGPCSAIRTISRDKAGWLSAQEREEIEAVRARLNQQLQLASWDTKEPVASTSQASANDCVCEDEYHPSQGWRSQPHHLTKQQLWERVREEAQRDADSEPALASNLYSTILAHPNLEKTMSFLLANKLANPTMLGMQLMRLISEAYEDDPSLIDAALADLQAVYDRDPACDDYSQAMLYFKGFQAVQCQRVAHWLWQRGRKSLALAIQSRMSEAFHVDIHPAAVIGRGVMIDHATGVVIGETAVVGDNVSMLHHVTLGGSGTGRGVRHPTIGHGVLLGAGVTVLGPVVVGAGSKVGAGSVVVSDIPCHCVAVGVPARILKRDIIKEPVQEMDQCVDYVLNYEI
ncbi:Serine acetyltransferase 5 [Tetrabaena socialis]|uniref:serine O-acetyltransferase n=1 Tax=Tetrabaena socialis TaxID=47790 RepID=A0A2J8ACB5_9CHLO|nr:Serine acetyltransferase 5 [Tetrabaena socialis]|eukprot:PNH10165.1 Serine acetyltransferase 5 [Tetrabaena socialis]